MKIRSDFVTNSSSSSFIITNDSDKILTLEDFIRENEWLYDKDEWYKGDYTKEQVFKEAKNKNIIFNPHETKTIECGDHVEEDGIVETLIHNNLCEKHSAISMISLSSQLGIPTPKEYIDKLNNAREKSDNFSWKFGESYH